MTMNPELEGLHRQFDDLKSRTTALVTGLTDADFNWRSAPRTWSVGECLSHLIIFGEMAKPKVEAMIEQARHRQLYSDGLFRYSWWHRWLIEGQEPPYRMRLRTYPSLTPPSDHRLSDAVPAFLSLQDWFQDRVVAANGLDLTGVRARLPAGVSFPLGLWFQTLATHERRHLWQGEQVMARLRAVHR